MQRLLIALAMFIGLFSAAAPAAEPQNWLRNNSFEQAARNLPAAWRTQTWNGQGTFEHATVGRTGKRSVSISSERGGDLSWTSTIPVEPFARYRLTGWIKTEDVKPSDGRGALLNLHGIEGAQTRALVGTNDWTQVELTFTAQDQDSIQVNCLFGGFGLATGRA
ncbi:MAG TPA: carbohydrate binding domain-containing protein, partial [Bryobacteraceae bacterium]|nr:carbohydrate binding domain-containing protein [Bryobacteraceae bacterium]